MSKKHPLALYVGRFGHPDISASGQRVYNVGVMLRDSGWDVKYITAAHGSKSCYYDGFSFQSVAPKGHVSKARALCNLVFEGDLIRAAVEMCVELSPSIVILYNASGLLQQRLMRVCRKLEIAVFGDVTEWYSASTYMDFANLIRVCSVDWRIRHSDIHLAGVISISTFLHNYYQKREVRSFELPPVFGDDAFVERTNRRDGPLRIIYAGSPAQKDNLSSVLKAYCMRVAKGDSIEFDVVGLTEGELRDLFPDVIKPGPLPSGLKAWGRQPRHVVLQMLASADICFLIRESKRYAQAGFSTKFAECMCSGVLMACNTVGGADLLLEDGVNGFIVDGSNAESIAAIIDKVSHMRTEDLSLMSRSTVLFARRMFSRDAYTSYLNDFLSV